MFPGCGLYFLDYLQGAFVANYPWDGIANGLRGSNKTDNDATFQYLARSYASLNPNMTSPSNEFPSGITNGAAWYPVTGGMQVGTSSFSCLHGYLSLKIACILFGQYPSADFALELMGLKNCCHCVCKTSRIQILSMCIFRLSPTLATLACGTV